MAMTDLNLFLKNNGYEYVSDVDSGIYTTDGGSCLGHWFDIEVHVLGTAGNMSRNEVVRVYKDDGYIMDGCKTGELNPDWEWSF